MKCYVTYFDAGYVGHAKYLLECLNRFSQYKIICYTVNFDYECDLDNVIVVKYEIPFIGDIDYRLFLKGAICEKSLEDFPDYDFCYIDADCLPFPNIDEIFTSIDKITNYPLPCLSHFKAVKCNDSLKHETNLCDILNINYLNKFSHHRGAGIILYNKLCDNFIKYWSFLCQSEKLINESEKFAPGHDETILNALLWRDNSDNNIGKVYLNTPLQGDIYEYLDFLTDPVDEDPLREPFSEKPSKINLQTVKCLHGKLNNDNAFNYFLEKTKKMEFKETKKQKIAVLFSAYNCAAHIDKVFEPWLELKDELGLVLAATNGRYSLSPEDKNDAKGSHSLLKLVGKKLDFLLHSSGTGELWTEEQGRNYMLNFALDRNVDLIWVIDADEYYTKEQILKIINFINENQHFDSYDVQFKNYAFKYPYWVDGFSKSVVFWADRHEGVKDFYFDCDIRYKDGLTNDNNENKTLISKNIAFVDHYSWLEADPRTSDKIINQNRKYDGPEGCRCVFKYDSENKLIFNKDFYDNRNLPVPIVHKTNKENNFIFDIIYKRQEHCFYVVNTQTNDTFDFNVYDDKGELLFMTTLTIAPGVDYYVKAQRPVTDEMFYRVVSKKNQDIIFDKEFHLNF